MRYKFWLGILITIVCLYFFYLTFKNIRLLELYQATKEANYFFILIYIVLQFFTYLLRAGRWGYILEPVKKIRLANLFKTTIMGFMANFIFPLRIGEVLKAYLIGKQENISKSASLATVVVERIFDLLILFLFLLLVLMFFPFPEGFENIADNLRHWGFISFIVYLAMLAMLSLLIIKPDQVIGFLDKKLTHLAPGLLRRGLNLLDSFAHGLSSLKRSRHLLSIISLSIFIWLVIAFSFYVAFAAFEIQLSFFSAVFLCVAVAIGVALPSTPGFIGTFEIACGSALILLGARSDKAAGYTLIVHAAAILPVIVVGLFLAAREQISLKQLRQLE